MPKSSSGNSSSLSFGTGISTGDGAATVLSHDQLLGRYLKEHAQSRPLTDPSIASQETEVSGDVAPWLGAVQRRLNASIGITGASTDDGTWLEKDVVAAANSFFEVTSYLLPGEPYLYALHSGELVAEFENAPYRMTLILSKDAAIALAAIGGETIHKRISLTAAAPQVLRRELSTIIDGLHTDQHGLEAKR
jgi:hypothetical protein